MNDPIDRAIRPATSDDAAACAAIYAPYVTDTVITFEEQPPTVEEMSARIAEAHRAHTWLVLEEGGEIVGYAYAHRFHPRAAYRWACESAIYLAMGRRRTGAGRALYTALFERLTDRGFRWVFACMTTPNPASAGLHAALGFTEVGLFREVGWKNGGWHDVVWYQRPLGEPVDPPAELS